MRDIPMTIDRLVRMTTQERPGVHFRDGPLAGITQPKNPVHGRMPLYRDADGRPVPTARLEVFRVHGCNCHAFALYCLESEQTPHWTYRWLDHHSSRNGCPRAYAPIVCPGCPACEA